MDARSRRVVLHVYYSCRISTMAYHESIWHIDMTSIIVSTAPPPAALRMARIAQSSRLGCYKHTASATALSMVDESHSIWKTPSSSDMETVAEESGSTSPQAASFVTVAPGVALVARGRAAAPAVGASSEPSVAGSPVGLANADESQDIGQNAWGFSRMATRGGVVKGDSALRARREAMKRVSAHSQPISSMPSGAEKSAPGVAHGSGIEGAEVEHIAGDTPQSPDGFGRTGSGECTALPANGAAPGIL